MGMVFSCCVLSCCSDQIPSSDASRVVLPPLSSGDCLCGAFSAYADDYDAKVLGDRLTLHDWQVAMDKINDAISSFFPCGLCFAFNYLCAVCTLGLSCVPGYCCSESAVEALNAELAELNYQHKRDGVEFVFCRSMPWISWLEVRVIKDFAALHGANNPSSSTPFLTQAPGYS